HRTGNGKDFCILDRINGPRGWNRPRRHDQDQGKSVSDAKFRHTFSWSGNTKARRHKKTPHQTVIRAVSLCLRAFVLPCPYVTVFTTSSIKLEPYFQNGLDHAIRFAIRHDCSRGRRREALAARRSEVWRQDADGSHRGVIQPAIICVIRSIKRLQPECNVGTFPDQEPLRDGAIDVPVTWAGEHISAHSERTGCRQHDRGCVCKEDRTGSASLRFE